MPRKKAEGNNEEKPAKAPKTDTEVKKEEKTVKKEAKKKEPASDKAKKESDKTADAVENGQPVINIGLVGHVDHGKTTLTEALTGKWTDTHSEEVKRGITIRLGYADAVFRKCPQCQGTDAFQLTPECPIHKIPTVAIRKVSFVDAPGHESLMATMLSGATIMDGAILLIAANEKCPQPQTREHLQALEISGIKNIVIVQNKIDLIPKERVLQNYKQIKEFIKGSPIESAPIIPVSALRRVNVDALVEAIENTIPTPERKRDADSIMFIARSFDINKPGAKPESLVGGVLGGAIMSGRLAVGDKIEIRPGRVTTEANQITSKPIVTTILEAMTGGIKVKEVFPGGSVAVLTSLDPGIVKSDALVGNVVGYPGKLPPVWYEFELETHLLERVVGAQQELKVDQIKLNEILMLNANSAATVGFVVELSKNRIRCKLKLPLCANEDSQVTISRRVGTRFRLIGYGIIKKPKK
jgi:translation initiation factor 2 subunit 3